MQKIEIYTTTYCPYCDRAKALLKRKGFEYKEINAEDDEIRAQMVERAGGKMTVPQIFIGDTHVGGSDDLHALDAKGELDKLINS